MYFTGSSHQTVMVWPGVLVHVFLYCTQFFLCRVNDRAVTLLGFDDFLSVYKNMSDPNRRPW